MFILISSVFIFYLALALHGMQHSTIRLIGAAVVVLAVVIVFMQIAYIRMRLYRVEYVAGGGSIATGVSATSGNTTNEGVVRSYALQIDLAASATALSALKMSPNAGREQAFTVMCTDRGGPSSKLTSRDVQYKTVRRIAVIRGSGGADALCQDVLSGSVRYIVLASDTWRILPVSDADTRRMFPTQTYTFWCFDIARVNQAEPATVVPKATDDQTVSCSVPILVLPFTSVGANGTAVALDAVCLASQTSTRALVHAWGYGWH